MNIYKVRAGTGEWGETAGVVVIASNEENARKLASEECGREGEEPWLNANCELIGTTIENDEQEKIVLVDYHEP